MKNFGYSPWGQIQDKTTFYRGISFVSTAGHGGFMISNGFANKHFSKYAIDIALKYNNYLCYEEDCAYAIPLYELMRTKNPILSSIHMHTTEEYIFNILSRWYPNYLLQLGLTPSETEYNYYLNSKKTDEMRANKDPDLIISASSIDNDSVIVTTADYKKHIVTAASYKIAYNSPLNLLSHCNIYKEA
jgi:hypothetical protein